MNMPMAFRLALRELRGGLRGFYVLLICLALGVAAIAAVGTVRESVARGLQDEGAVLLGGDSLPVKKPDPAPLLHCCMVTGVAASECIYVGDHQRDIEAGNNAGMHTLIALFGYIADDEDTGTWQADAAIATPQELFDWLDAR